MSLKEYDKKRNFNSTREPKGEKKSSGQKLKFVVQRHKATNLHYDFRLELDDVLKSWAVPKGPSLNPRDKRLAMKVEDHPYDYKDFKGIIPEGNYGAGIVEIWDKGYYTALPESKGDEQTKILKSALKSGNLKFVLHGKKLKGEFALVKFKNDSSANKNAWLLIKHKDEYAVDTAYNSEDETAANSPINKALAKKKEKRSGNSETKKNSPQLKKKET